MILSLLRSPSGFCDDWRGYVRNQIGHALAVGALPVLLIGPEAAAVALALYALWEAVQWRYYGGKAWDGFEDMAFQATGVLFAVTLWWPLVAIAALHLASGALRRAGR